MTWKTGSRSEGSALITVLIIAFIGAVLGTVVYRASRRATTVSGNRRSSSSALQIAEAGKEHYLGALAEATDTTIRPQPNTTITPYQDVTFGGGTYTVQCSANAALDSVWIRSRGVLNDKSALLEIIGRIAPAHPLNAAGIKGAITSRSNVTITGNITVDGRDWDSSNTSIFDSMGTWGISSCGSVSQQGNAKVGGNGTEPIKNAGETIIQEGGSVADYPSTPEEVLGLEPGALDEYKTSSLPTPFEGIYYLTNDAGPLHFGNSSGILIVHNDTWEAELQITDGTFKGIIIADKMDKINGNATIIGSVVTLTASEVSTFGNGNAIIRYSSRVINNLAAYCKNLRKSINEASWREVDE